MRFSASILLAVLPAGVAIAQPAAVTGDSNGTTVYVNAKVYTADKEAEATAFAVADGKFVAVGGEAAVKPFLDRGAVKVDLGGRFVVPGIGDDHFHGAGGGPGVALADVRSMAELIGALKVAAEKAPPGALIVSNSDWHEAQLAEQRKPVIADLDKASTTVPIVVVRGGHSIFLNTPALAKFGVSLATPVPAGGSIERDVKGQLTGELVDTAKALVPLPKESPLNEQDLIDTQREMNAHGVTSVRVPGTFRKGAVTDLYPLAQRMGADGKLSLRYTLLRRGPGFAGGTLEELRSGPQQGEGDAWARVDGVKLMVDGGFEGAHFFDPYAEPYGKGGTFHGIAVVPPEKTMADVRALHQLGWRVAMHAAGDAGIEQALKAFEAAAKDKPITGDRWSLEHAFVVKPDQIQRIKTLGVALSVQDHLYLAAPSMEAFWGRARAEHVTPVKSYRDAGILVAGGTDSPVVPSNPFWAMYHFASRDTISAGVYGYDEHIASRKALVDMFTINYAKLVGTDQELGSIAAGKRADFAVLDTNLLTASATELRDTKAVATYIDGREVYSSDRR